MTDCCGEVVSIVSQMICLACDQHTGRQVHGNRDIVRIHVGIKRVLLILIAKECFGHHKTDLIHSCGVEHAADQCQGHDLQIRGPDTGCLGKPGISLDGGSIHGKHCTGAVPYHIAVAKLRFQLGHHAVNVVHGCVDVLQLLEDGHLGAQAVLNGKHKKSHLTKVDAEMPVELLISHDQAASVDIDDHGRGDLHGIGTVHIHHMGRVTVLLVPDTPGLMDTVQYLVRDMPTGGQLFKITALFMDDRFQYRVHRVSFHILQDISACLRMHRGDRSVR